MIPEELLLSLIILTAALPPAVSCLGQLKQSVSHDSVIQDEIALCQLRKILSLASELSISDNQLTFRYHDESCTLSKINRHLIMKPGTQILMQDTEQVYFRKDGSLLSIIYEKNNRTYEKPLIPTE